MNLTRLAPLALGVALALTLAACGDEPEASAGGTSTAATPAEGGDVDRYCELVAELDALGEQIFADVPQDASPEEYMRREQQLLEQGAAQLDELDEVVPDAIAEDSRILLDGLRARAATGENPDQDAASAAEERILAFEEENCA